MQSPSACSRRSFLFVAVMLMALVAVFDLALYVMAFCRRQRGTLPASWIPPGLPVFLMNGFFSVVVPSIGACLDGVNPDSVAIPHRPVQWAP